MKKLIATIQKEGEVEFTVERDQNTTIVNGVEGNGVLITSEEFVLFRDNKEVLSFDHDMTDEECCLVRNDLTF